MKQDVNLAICGHAWHGKSTLVGKTVAELEMVSQRQLQRFDRMAQQGRDPSLIFALMVFRQKDVTKKDDEAGRGITVLPSFVRFDFDTHRVTVIDTPGQEEFTNNRFAGMFSADCAALVVSAKDGVEAVTEQVIRTLAGYEIPLQAVVVTKMDQIDYDQARFDEVVELTRLTLQMYEVNDDVPYIPTSAWFKGRSIMEPGEGITQFGEKLAWYDGPTFHDLLKGLRLEKLRPESPVRVVIHSADIHEQVPGVGTAFTGLIESGHIRRDQTLLFQPASAELGEDVTAQIRSVQLTRGHIATPGYDLEVGQPRQLVGVALRGVSTRKNLREIFKGRGTVAGLVEDPPTVATRFIADVTVFDPKVTIRVGQQFTMHCHVDKVAVIVKRIEMSEVRGSVDPDDEGDEPEDEPNGDPVSGGPEAEEGESAAAKPDSAKLGHGEVLYPNKWARIEFEAIRPVAIETRERLPALSKLVLRLTNVPIGLGRCLEILA